VQMSRGHEWTNDLCIDCKASWNAQKSREQNVL